MATTFVYSYVPTLSLPVALPIFLVGALRPVLDVDGVVGAAYAEYVGIGAVHVADIDRTVEHHGVDGDGSNAPGGARTGGDAAGDVHLRQHPAAEDVAAGIGVGGHGEGDRKSTRLTSSH